MSSATLILALPGTGKTSLLAYLLKERYKNHGKQLLNNCCGVLERINQGRKTPFDFPDKPPIYADVTSFKVKFKIGYDKWFEPYAINPYYMGVVREREMPIQYVLPYGQIFIPEIQKYGDSRKSTTFPSILSRVFEIRRHFNLDIFMDGHRGSFVDLKIRALCNRILDLKYQEHDYDKLGRIERTRWYCNEFSSFDAYEEFYKHSDVEYKEIVYENEGNIFNDYDSFGCESEFVPPEGQQFSMLNPLSQSEIKKLPAEIAQFYNPSEPKGFRK